MTFFCCQLVFRVHESHTVNSTENRPFAPTRKPSRLPFLANCSGALGLRFRECNGKMILGKIFN